MPIPNFTKDINIRLVFFMTLFAVGLAYILKGFFMIIGIGWILSIVYIFYKEHENEHMSIKT